jgi:hypothetical protein
LVNPIPEVTLTTLRREGMMRILAAVALLALAGSAFGGYSLGFKHAWVPGDATGGEMTNMYMLRFGAMVSPQFRMEGLLGYNKWSSDTDPGDTEQENTTWALGASGYYLVANPANTQFSIGGQFIYAKNTSEDDGVDGPETTGFVLSPVMRVDFAIPGAERFALFTEYGIRYYSATTTTESGGQEVDNNWSGYQIYAPTNILAGVYYVF